MQPAELQTQLTVESENCRGSENNNENDLSRGRGVT